MNQQAGISNPTGPLGIVAAIEDELMPTVRRLRLKKEGRWWRGKVGLHDVAAGLSGVGGVRAVATLEALYGELHIRAVYNMGFVGALTARHNAGDVLVFGSVIRLTAFDPHRPAPRLPTSVDAFSDAPAAFDAPKLLSSDILVHDPAHKRRLAEETGTDAVDMESFALAEACRRLHLRLCIVRGVSDPVTMALPEALPQWVKPDGRRNVFRAATYLALRPWRVPTVIKLAKNSARAANAIAEHLSQVILARI